MFIYMNTYNIDKIEKILYNIDNMNNKNMDNKNMDNKNYDPIMDIEFIYFLLLIAVFDYNKYFKNLFNLREESMEYYEVD